MALHKAVKCNRLQQVRYLLDSELFVDIDVNAMDDDSMTPLMHCCILEHERTSVNIAKVLLNHGADISTSSKNGTNSLALACRMKKRALVSLFLSHDPCLLNAQDANGNTVLHISAKTGDKQIMRLLLEMYKKYRVSVDVMNRNGETPLILATKNGHLGCARLLVVSGNASFTIKDNVEFQTALEWAQKTDKNTPDGFFTDLVKGVSFKDRHLRTLSAGAVENADRLPSVPDRPKSTSFATSHERLRISQCGTVTTLMNTEFEHPRPPHIEVIQLYEMYCAQNSTSYRQAAKVTPQPAPSPVPTTEDDSSTVDAEIPWLPGKLLRKKSAKCGKKGLGDSTRKLNNLSSTAQTVHALTALKRKTRGLLLLSDQILPRTPRKAKPRTDTPDGMPSDEDKSSTSSPSNSQSSRQSHGTIIKKVKTKKPPNTGKSEGDSDSGDFRNSRSSSLPVSRPTSGESEKSNCENTKKSYLRKKDTLTSVVAKLQVIQSESECSPEPSPTIINTQSGIRTILPRHDSGFKIAESPPDGQLHGIDNDCVLKTENMNKEPENSGDGSVATRIRSEDLNKGDNVKSERQVKQKAKRKDILRRSLSKLRLVDGQNPSLAVLNEGLQSNNFPRITDSNDEATTPRMLSTFPLERDSTFFKNRCSDSCQGSPRTTTTDQGVFKFPRGLDSLKKPVTVQQRSPTLVALDIRIQELKDELKVMKKNSRLSTKVHDVSATPASLPLGDSTSHWQRDSAKKHDENKHHPLSAKKSDSSESGKNESSSHGTNKKDAHAFDLKKQRRGTRSGLSLTIDLGEFRRQHETKHHSKRKGRRRKRFGIESIEYSNPNTDDVNIQITVEDDSGVQIIDHEAEQQKQEHERQQKRAKRVLAWKLKHPARAPSRLRQVKVSTSQAPRRSKNQALANSPLKIYLNSESNPLTRAHRMPSVGQTRKRVCSVAEANKVQMPKAIKSLFRGK